MRQLEIARRQLHFFQTEGAYLSLAQKSLWFALHKQLASSPTLIRLPMVKLLSFEKKNHMFCSPQMLTITLERRTHMDLRGAVLGCACCTPSLALVRIGHPDSSQTEDSVCHWKCYVSV